MKVSAHVESSRSEHQVSVATEGRARAVQIPGKEAAAGSSVNGGELLALAVATCYCNDVFREAAARGVQVERVEVDAEATFGGPGEPGRNLRYRARLVGNADAGTLRALGEHTDRVAEIHNTLRLGMKVELTELEVLSTVTC